MQGMSARTYFYGALILLASAAALIAAGVAYGQLHIGFLLIIPVIYGSGIAGIAAALLVFMSFVLFALSSIHGTGKYEQGTQQPGGYSAPVQAPDTGRKFGGIVFIGPIPIIFGSDRKTTGYMLAAAIIILVLLLAAFAIGFI